MHTSSKRMLAIIGIGLPLMAVGVNFSIVNLAMSTLQQRFNATVSELQWLLNSSGIFVSVLMVTMGKLADTYGRRRVYFVGTFLICLASLIAGLAPKLIWIICAQGIIGMGASIIIPISQALFSHLYSEKKRAQAISLWATLMCIALGIGPILGGSILETLGWRWIFLINIPITLAALYPLILYVEESKSKTTNSKIDFLGIFFLILTIGSAVVTIMQAAEWGLNVLWVVGLFVLSLSLFIFSERQSTSPIIRPEFFFHRTFLLSTFANFCIVFFVWGDFFLLPYYLQVEHNLSPFQTGLVMLLVTTPVVLFSSKIGKIYNKIGPKPLMIFGFILFTLSSISQLFLNAHNLTFPLIAALCFGMGWVIAWGPSITTAVSSVPHDAAGLASGTFTTVQEIGGTLGLTIVGTAFRLTTDFASGALVLLISSILGIIFSLTLQKKAQEV